MKITCASNCHLSSTPKQCWETTLKAQWAAYRELQKHGWQIKKKDLITGKIHQASPKEVQKVARGLVHHAIEQLRELSRI